MLRAKGDEMQQAVQAAMDKAFARSATPGTWIVRMLCGPQLWLL